MEQSICLADTKTLHKRPVRRHAVGVPERIAATHDIIRPYIRRTPVVDVDGADIGLPGVRLTLTGAG